MFMEGELIQTEPWLAVGIIQKWEKSREIYFVRSREVRQKKDSEFNAFPNKRDESSERVSKLPEAKLLFCPFSFPIPPFRST